MIIKFTLCSSYYVITYVFNLFNYGLLLVHSRALLSSQIAFVICFIKLLVAK